jgi:hypothetical protein
MFTKLADAIERAIAEGKVTREEVFRRMLDSARASGVPEEAIRRAAKATSSTPVSTLSERLQGKATEPVLREFFRIAGSELPGGSSLRGMRQLVDEYIGPTDPRTRAGYEEQRRRRLAPQLAAEDAAKRDYRNLSRELSDLIEPRSARLADLAGAQQLRNLHNTPGVQKAFDLVGVPMPAMLREVLDASPALNKTLGTLRGTQAEPGPRAHEATTRPPRADLETQFPSDVRISIPASRALPATRGLITRGESTLGEKVRSAIELATGRKPPGAREAAAGWHEVGEAEALRAHAGNPAMAPGALADSVMKPVTLERRTPVSSEALEEARGLLDTMHPERSREYYALRRRLDESANPPPVHVQPHASHMDVRPIVREEVAMYGSPSAREDLRRLRSLTPDDNLGALLYRRVGGRANAPIAIDSRRERAMRRELARQREMGNVGAIVPHRAADAGGTPLPRVTDSELRLPAGIARYPLRALADRNAGLLQHVLKNTVPGTAMYTAQTSLANRMAERALEGAQRGRYVPKSILKK